MSIPTKVRGRPKGVTLTHRDQDLMAVIAKDGFINGSEAKGQFWADARSKSYLIRLRRLCVHGYLQAVRGDMGTRLGYILGPKGRAYIESCGAKIAPVQTIAKTYRTGYDHDVKLHGIRKTLIKSPLVFDFKTEAELRSELGQASKREKFAKVPDAFFHLKTTGDTLGVALELELTRKSNKRYQEVCRRLITSPQWDVVFFICKNEALAKLIEDHAQQFLSQASALKWTTRKNRLYFSTLGEFLAAGLDAPFVGEDGAFTLNRLAEKVAQASGEEG